MKKGLILLSTALVLVIGAVVINTIRYGSPQPEVESVPVPAERGRASARKLADAITFRTISRDDPARFDRGTFRAFHDFLAESFPRVHKTLERETVNDLSLLYRWKGRNPDLAPVLLTAHLDVVPVEPGTREEWSHPPFAGEIRDGHVWGRGALDDKMAVITLLQSLETLVRDGFRPERTLYLAFGHDEEVGGTEGAQALVETLAERGVEPAWMVDEGGLVTEGVVPGVAPPVALIQVAEKGYLSLELTAKAPGGHSSMPPKNTAVGIVARAVSRLEANPVPARMIRPVRALFAHLAPELDVGQRAALANTWLLGPLLKDRLTARRRTNALLRTTTAPTIFNGGMRDNVLPTRARAVVNFRLLPGDSTADVLAHARSVMDDDRVRIRPLDFRAEPPPVSATDTPAYRRLERTVKQVFPDALAAPSLLVATTDARHYAELTDQVYRFRPVRVSPGDLDGIHGTDERVAVDDLGEAVTFYRQLIRRGAGP